MLVERNIRIIPQICIIGVYHPLTSKSSSNLSSLSLPLSPSLSIYIYVCMCVCIYTYIHTYIYMMHCASESLPKKNNKQLRKQPNVHIQRTTYIAETSCTLRNSNRPQFDKSLAMCVCARAFQCCSTGRAPFDIQNKLFILRLAPPNALRLEQARLELSNTRKTND
jgi:hypothetical protein